MSAQRLRKDEHGALAASSRCARRFLAGESRHEWLRGRLTE
jgi:hypothetical protein